MPKLNLKERTINGRVHIRLRWRDSLGKQREKTFPNRKEAKFWIKNNPELGNRGSASAALELTFKSASERYVEMLRSGSDGRPPREPTHVMATEQKLRIYAYPVLGRKKLSVIDRALVKHLMAHCIDKASSRTTASAAFAAAKAVLQMCSDDDLIVKNPASGLSITKNNREVEEVQIYSKQDMEKLRQAVDELSNHSHKQIRNAWELQYRPMFFLLLSTGIRVSELCGLQFADFDDEFKSVKINRRIATPTKHTPEASRIGRPKSKHGTRRLDIAYPIRAMLADVRASNEHPWVFASPTGKFFEYRNIRERMWKRLISHAEVEDFGIHSLRHYFASTMIAAKCDLVELSRALGHHSVQFTIDIYGHLLPENVARREQLADDIANALDL